MLTYHLAHSSQRSLITGYQRTAIVDPVGRANADRIRNHDMRTIPMSGHSPTESIKEILSLASNTLSTTGLPVHCLANGLGLAGLQRTDIKGLNRGLRIGEGGRIGGV